MTHIYTQSEKELASLLAQSDSEAEVFIQSNRCFSGQQVRDHIKKIKSVRA